MYDDILVPVDGGNHSRKSINEAIMLANAGEPSVVHGLHAFQLERDKEQFDNKKRENPKHIQTLIENAKESGVEFRTETRIGAPADQITAYVEENDIDAIVMATDAPSGLFKRYVIGSVTEQTQRKVSCPVIALPPENGEEDTPE